VEYRILGPLEVRDGDGVTMLPRRRERALLAALLLRPGEVVSTDRLADAIWGETPPRTAVGSLQNAVSELRKALGHDVVITRSPGYALVIDPETIDAVRFERAVTDAARMEPAERAESLSAALALWRGPALADLADEPFAAHEASRLDELRLAATEERIAADLELGRGADLVAELEAHVAASPLRERLRGLLMLALYRSGRQAEALEAYQDARRALVDGLGIDPSPALQELERRVLRQDPSLLAFEPSLPASAPFAGTVPTRKTVTVLAAALDDVSEIDPEPLRDRIDRFLEAVSDATGRHGGTLDRFLGSDAVAVFGVPVVHEDDALRAARAAVELREALAAAGDAVRVGLATGEVLAIAADAPVIGDVVAVAAALRDAAPRGRILAAEATHSLVRDAVTAGEPTTVGARDLAARSLEAVRGAKGRARRLDTPFVGRRDELDTLRDALASATEDRRCVTLTVLGDAGIGKTRLVEELAATLVRGRVLAGHCAPYGEGATFLPLLDLVRRAAGDVTEHAVARLLPDDDDGRLAARHVAALHDRPETVPRGEAFWAVRVLLEALAGDDPLVVVLDDVHWAESALLDLVEYLAERTVAPVVLVCLARPELLDARPGWAGAASAVTAMQLGPLAPDEARALLDGLDRDRMEERERRRLVERGGGNPLHLEQLYTFVADEGGDPTFAEVPPTVEAILGSRIDLLSPDARETLQRAAVVGPDPSRGIVVELCEPSAPVDAALLELTRRGLLHPEHTEGPDDAYRFHHALLRDVAYGSLPKEMRAALHERAAAWLDREGSGPDELVGWHLEQAYGYRSELHPEDPELARLAEKAGGRLARAGIRATRAVDVTAIPLLRRAARLLPADPSRAAVLIELGPWLRSTGDHAAATSAFDEALSLSTAHGADVLAARAEIEIAWDEAAFRTERPMRSLEDLIVERMPIIEAADDDRGLMRAWQFLGTTHVYDEQMAAFEHAARRTAEHARRAGWLPFNAMSAIASALVHGPKPAPQALREVGALLDECGDSRYGWAAVASPAAVLHAMNDELEPAEELLARSLETLTLFDDRLRIMTSWMPNRLSVARLQGDRELVHSLLAEWRERLTAAGHDAYLSTALAELADQVVETSPRGARALVEEAAARASADDRLVQALVHSVAAKAAAADGDAEEAMARVASATTILVASDALADRARMELARARVLELLGENVEPALDEAVRLLKAKRNIRAIRAIEAAGTSALV
jgi:DNA-binding SARP family transcriptional activator/class 3 adenylate cyclase